MVMTLACHWRCDLRGRPLIRFTRRPAFPILPALLPPTHAPRLALPILPLRPPATPGPRRLSARFPAIPALRTSRFEPPLAPLQQAAPPAVPVITVRMFSNLILTAGRCALKVQRVHGRGKLPKDQASGRSSHLLLEALLWLPPWASTSRHPTRAMHLPATSLLCPSPSHASTTPRCTSREVVR